MKKIKYKILTSLLLTFAFIITSLSGISLFISPKGRIANWINWTFCGFTKDEWADIHIVFVSLFLICAVLHLFYFNWKVFWNYIKTKRKEGLSHPRELFISVLVFILIVIGTLTQMPPVISIVRLGEKIDAGYETALNKPPIPHAEEMSIAEFAEKINKISAEEMINRLVKAGYKVSSADEKIITIAERNNVSPSDLFRAMNPESSEDQRIPGYAGYGQMTITEVCGMMGIENSVAEDRLIRAGLTEFNSDETLKQLADKYSMKPIDIAKIIADSKAD
ncbi:DUF4405 domain-containing protein [bacterium]|nr:DUF4405 domain-containing protein [bacterium]